MESFAVAEVARAGGLPFIAVRVIIDTADDDLPEAVLSAADSAGQVRIGRLLGAIARAPGDLPGLIRLAARYRQAGRSLARVAGARALSSSALAAAPAADVSDNVRSR
jgi:adenosylhomocysteine nucleosidase